MNIAIGKRLLAFSAHDAAATSLIQATESWGCIATVCPTPEQFRGRIEGADYDLVLVEGSAGLKQLLGEADPEGDVLRQPLAEIERRHVLRVLASTGGNKTRAAKVLGIDTKTLYNKLKLYESGRLGPRKRAKAADTGDTTA